MTLFDLLKLIRHYFKFIIIIPLICAVFAVAGSVFLPQTYIAKATLLTNGDIALAGGFAQNEATIFSQNGIEVSSVTDTAYRTITIEAQGNDYGGCIAAANATVLAAAEDCREVNDQASITTNEATAAESTAPAVPKSVALALLIGLFIAICWIVLIDIVKMPIKSRHDIEAISNLPVIGTIPNRDRGEKLLANIRFLSEDTPSRIAVIPVGFTGAALTCAELSAAFERSGTAVSRFPGSPHAEGFHYTTVPGVVSIAECAPLSEGIGAAYIAKASDVVILCVSEWRDSRKALAALVEELRFAKANLGGVVFLTTSYSEKGLL